MIKEKPCKGQGHAKGYGCGKITKVENRVYGLGKMCGCYSDWLLNSEPGKIKMAKSILKVQKPRLDFEAHTQSENNRTLLKKAKNSTKKAIHDFIRERDMYKPCISCGVEWNPDFQAGHHYKAETFETLKYDLDNISGQCVRCNIFLDGNFDNYALNLPKRIGKERYDALVERAGMDKHHSKVWDIEGLKAIRENVRRMFKELDVKLQKSS